MANLSSNSASTNNVSRRLIVAPQVGGNGPSFGRFLVVWAVKAFGKEASFAQPTALLALAIGVAALVWFVRRCLRSGRRPANGAPSAPRTGGNPAAAQPPFGRRPARDRRGRPELPPAWEAIQ